jgi:gliding motility-associated-like protein
MTYLHIDNDPLPNKYRFLYTLTIECGNTHNANPLNIFDPEQPNGAFAQKAWQLDSAKNVMGVPDPCLSFPSPPCYSVFYYHVDIALPRNRFGYLASVLDCCRPAYTNLQVDTTSIFRYEDPATGGLSNDPCTPEAGKNTVYNGISSVVRIPPIADPDKDLNSSPQFVSQDTIFFVCKDSLFSSVVQANDPDGDSVAYHFSQPYSFNVHWTCGPGNCSYVMLTRPPMLLLNYAAGFSVSQPAGSGLRLDQQSGYLHGMFPDTGTYVVPISAMEYRQGKFLDSVTKDIMIRVFDCSLLPPPKAIIPSLMNNCNDFTVQFTNNSTPDYHGYNWLRTFLWNFGDGDTSSAVYPAHTYTDTGSYKTSLIIFPGLHCADTAYSKVLIYPSVRAAFSYTDTCSNQLLTFTDQSISTSGPINKTQWKVLLLDKTIDSSNAQNLTYTFTQAPQTYTIILNIANTEGCATSDTQNVSIFPSPHPLATHDTILTLGASLALHADDGNEGVGGSFLWTPPFGLSDPESPNPILNSRMENTYYVTMINAHGCALTDSIHVIYYAGPDIYVPTAFSPNGDGRNDILTPVVVGISSGLHFRIFNRAGQLVFSSSRPGQGWDGYMNGHIAPAGTYVWEAMGLDYMKKMIVRKGTVELIR